MLNSSFHMHVCEAIDYGAIGNIRPIATNHMPTWSYSHSNWNSQSDRKVCSEFENSNEATRSHFISNCSIFFPRCFARDLFTACKTSWIAAKCSSRFRVKMFMNILIWMQFYFKIWKWGNALLDNILMEWQTPFVQSINS